MYFQVDSKALTDERIVLLGARLGIGHSGAFYACCKVWCWLYKQCGRAMTEEEVDAVSGHSGFAKAMEQCQLADYGPEGLRIRGDSRARKYGEFCKRQLERIRKRFPLHDVGEDTNGIPAVEPPVIPKTGLISSGDLDLIPDSESGKSSPRAEAESWMAWFNQRFRRRLTVTKAVTKAIGALMVAGYREDPDLRGVALFLESQWKGDPKMDRFLVPTTILRITAFEDRLSLAREWNPKHWGESPGPIPALRAVPAEPKGPAPEFMDRGEIAKLALGLASNWKGKVTK